MKRKIVLASILLLGLSAGVPASPDPEKAPAVRLIKDPKALLDWLRAKSPTSKASEARALQGMEAYSQSRARPNPSANVTLSDLPRGETNPPGLGFHETAIWSFGVSQELEIGKRGPRIEGARLRAEAARATSKSDLLDEVAGARAALAHSVFAEARREAVEEALTLTRQSLELQRGRYKTGDLAGLDLDRLELEEETLAAEAETSRAESTATLADCQARLFAECEVGGSDAHELVDPPGSNVLTAEAGEAKRPDVEALMLAGQASLEDARLARRRAWPDPTLSVGYTRDFLVISGDQPRTFSFGVTLPVPIFDRGARDAARAEAQASEARLTAEALRQRIRSDLSSLREREERLWAALSTARSSSLPRSRAILDATQKAAALGELSMTDLLLARRQHTELALRVLDLESQLFDVRTALRRHTAADLLPESEHANHD